MMASERKEYEVYRGLQRPLVLYMFKGRYIYTGVGSIFAGIICTLVVLSQAGLMWGLLTLCMVTGGGLVYTALGQRQGLHSKTRSKGIYIVEARIHRHHGTKNQSF